MLTIGFLALCTACIQSLASGYVISNEIRSDFAMNITIKRTFSTYKDNWLAYDGEGIYNSSAMSNRVEVPDPSQQECRNDADCLIFSLELTCLNGRCECRDACWIYTYRVEGLWGYYNYECGECGILGSECSSTLPCDEPGECSSKDDFCHCPEGEHREQICFIVQSPKITGLLFGGFLVFIVFALLIAAYNSYQGYRLYGTLCWCRYVGVGVRTPEAPPRIGPSKSPAYTREPQPCQTALEDDIGGAENYIEEYNLERDDRQHAEALNNNAGAGSLHYTLEDSELGATALPPQKLHDEEFDSWRDDDKILLIDSDSLVVANHLSRDSSGTDVPMRRIRGSSLSSNEDKMQSETTL